MHTGLVLWAWPPQPLGPALSLAALAAGVVGSYRRAPGCRPWDPMPTALTPRTPAAGLVLASAADIGGASEGPAERLGGLAQHTGVPLRVQAIPSHRAQALGSVALGHCPPCRALRLCFPGLGAPCGHGGQEAVPGRSPPQSREAADGLAWSSTPPHSVSRNPVCGDEAHGRRGCKLAPSPMCPPRQIGLCCRPLLTPTRDPYPRTHFTGGETENP